MTTESVKRQESTLVRETFYDSPRGMHDDKNHLHTKTVWIWKTTAKKQIKAHKISNANLRLVMAGETSQHVMYVQYRYSYVVAHHQARQSTRPCLTETTRMKVFGTTRTHP
jgi:hypothetical protein